jgi:RNA polymerase sigma factor (sigma-70 family)
MPDNALPTLRDFLVQRYDDLKRRLTRHLGSAEMAGDALQDTWLRQESLEQDEGIKNFSAYLLRMAVNIAIDHRRSNSRLLTSEDIEAAMQLPDSGPTPDETLEARSELDALIEVLQEMPVRRQKIMLMVRCEGYTQPEAAKALGLSLRTIEKELKLAHDFCAARTGRPIE